MATLIDLEASGALHRLDVAMEPDDQTWRYISVSPRLRTWIAVDLPNLVPQWESEQSPLEQLDELAWAFVSGQPLVYLKQFKPLRHISNGIWELKTPDLRVFGWFNAKDCFIGVVANQTSQIKRHRLYAGHCGEVTRFRDELKLDDPKFILGDDPHAVVSDFNYP